MMKGLRKQIITAHENKLRNQEQDKYSPDRAKPKAKSEPFKFQTIDNVESGTKDKPNQTTAIHVDDPETPHEPKGPRGRPPKTQSSTKPMRRTIEKPKNLLHDTEKDENRTRIHWRKATKIYLIDQFAKHGWEWPTTQSGQTAKLTQKGLGQIMIDLLGI